MSIFGPMLGQQPNKKEDFISSQNTIVAPPPGKIDNTPSASTKLLMAAGTKIAEGVGTAVAGPLGKEAASLMAGVATDSVTDAAAMPEVIAAGSPSLMTEAAPLQVAMLGDNGDVRPLRDKDGKLIQQRTNGYVPFSYDPFMDYVGNNTASLGPLAGGVTYG